MACIRQYCAPNVVSARKLQVGPLLRTASAHQTCKRHFDIKPFRRGSLVWQTESVKAGVKSGTHMWRAFDRRYVKWRHLGNQNFHSNRIGGLRATYAVHLWLIGKLVGDLVIIELFSQGAFVLSQYTHLTDTDGQTKRQTSISRCDLAKLDAHKKHWSTR